MERDVRRMTVYQTIIDNSIGRLSELFDEWLIENHKAIGEPIMAYELVAYPKECADMVSAYALRSSSFGMVTMACGRLMRL